MFSNKESGIKKTALGTNMAQINDVCLEIWFLK